mmetsp:Transcript_26273/g.87074  ORF Transcript_26273/g.87074 Transcript_26273/m.87074 type:complete len:253 (+) Transcript_26273:845-1603(+)
MSSLDGAPTAPMLRTVTASARAASRISGKAASRIGLLSGSTGRNETYCTGAQHAAKAAAAKSGPRKTLSRTAASFRNAGDLGDGDGAPPNGEAPTSCEDGTSMPTRFGEESKPKGKRGPDELPYREGSAASRLRSSAAACSMKSSSCGGAGCKAPGCSEQSTSIACPAAQGLPMFATTKAASRMPAELPSPSECRPTSAQVPNPKASQTYFSSTALCRCNPQPVSRPSSPSPRNKKPMGNSPCGGSRKLRIR